MTEEKIRELQNGLNTAFINNADQITEYYMDDDGNIIYNEMGGELIPKIKRERAGIVLHLTT